MKFIKKVILAALLLIIVTLIFRGWIYRHLVTYKSVGLRTDYLATEDKLIAYINTSSDKQADTDIEKIIKLGLSITSRQLHFTAGKNDIDPNKLITSKSAHCVGYSIFFATTCNYLLNKYGLADTWVAKPQVGKLFLLNLNIHKFFSASFFKDHDFVTIKNKKTGEIFAVDPTVNDYLWIDFITYE